MAAGDPTKSCLALDIYTMERCRGKTALALELVLGAPLAREMEALYQKYRSVSLVPEGRGVGDGDR